MNKLDRKFNGGKLRDMRIMSGKTLEEVAKAADFDTSSLSLWENGRTPGPKNLKKLATFYKVPISALFCMLLFFSAVSASASVNSFDAVRAIVGEASDQPFVGMVMVGEVIQARQNGVEGMAGFHSKHVKNERPWTWAKAWAAWILSLFTDFSHGATMFENVYRFGFPKSWDREKVVGVAQAGDHWFFTEVK